MKKRRILVKHDNTPHSFDILKYVLDKDTLKEIVISLSPNLNDQLKVLYPFNYKEDTGDISSNLEFYKPEIIVDLSTEGIPHGELEKYINIRRGKASKNIIKLITVNEYKSDNKNIQVIYFNLHKKHIYGSYGDNSLVKECISNLYNNTDECILDDYNISLLDINHLSSCMYESIHKPTCIKPLNCTLITLYNITSRVMDEFFETDKFHKRIHKDQRFQVTVSGLDSNFVNSIKNMINIYLTTEHFKQDIA